MSRPSISMETAQAIANNWDTSTSIAEVMEKAGIQTKDTRHHFRYRRLTEEMLSIKLPAHNPKFASQNNWAHTSEHIQINGTAIIFSDAHFWPNCTGPAYYGLLEVISKLKPKVILDNGDSFDGASISRHSPISFEHLPTLADEYENCKAHMKEIKDVAPKKVKLYRNVGNHDLRFEAKMASKVPEMIGMPSTTISELFPEWKHNYSVVFNDDVIAMHKWHCGIHAAWNNVLKGGKSIITSHTHRLGVRFHTDYSGKRFAGETGTLADPKGPQFSYGLDTPGNHQEGFMVIDFDEHGAHPDVAELVGDRIRLRGKYYG